MLEVKELRKSTKDGKNLLNGVSFRIGQGEFVGILGPSGAGKSLSLRCILGLTKATSGSILFEDNKHRSYEVIGTSGKRLRYLRMKMGVIFQGSNLVKQLTVLENVMLGRLARIPGWRSWLVGFTDKEAEMAFKALGEVGMQAYAGRVTGSLSGGEMQRVAIARAINQGPAIFLADEPVSSLDPKNSRSIMSLLQPLARSRSVLGVFHQPDLVARYCSRMIGIRDGKVVYDDKPTDDTEVLGSIYGDELESALRGDEAPVT